MGPWIQRHSRRCPAVQLLYLHRQGTANEQGRYEHESERDKIQSLKVAHAHLVCDGPTGRGKEIGNNHHVVTGGPKL